MDAEHYAREVLRRLRHTTSLTPEDMPYLTDKELYAIAGLNPAGMTGTGIDAALTRIARGKPGIRHDEQG